VRRLETACLEDDVVNHNGAYLRVRKEVF